MRTRLNEMVFLPGRLLVVSGVLFGGLFAVLAMYGTVRLGLGYLLFLPVCLVALALGSKAGVLAGGWALVLYWVGMRFAAPGALTLAPILIRLVGYCAVGAVVGYFAGQVRSLIAHATVAFDRLSVAEQDPSTNTPAASAFERSLLRRIGAGEAFSVVIAEVRLGRSAAKETRSDAAALDLASELMTLPGIDEVARMSPSRITALASPVEPGDIDELERRLSAKAVPSNSTVALGAAAFPFNGVTLVELVAAAIEDLYGRRAATREAAVAGPRP
jgi:hypothetical protein